MPDFAIILLPKENYWRWVEAARDYVMKFGANLTPDPDMAARYMAPNQIVTIAGLPNGYPAQGDIQAWFQRNYPRIRLDYIPVNFPEAFRTVLQARVEAEAAYALTGATIRLRWPTNYPVVLQPFGVNPELYRRWDLPGHEGIDIRAPKGANVYACAEGVVARVDSYHGDSETQPYGNSVRLQHRDGFLTIYAHLLRVSVRVGDKVTAGQIIGYAGQTGNAITPHLHLSLKKDGATAAGLTTFPRDFLDPTPLLDWPELRDQLTVADYPWPARRCLVGVHGRSGEPVMRDADYASFAQARVEAVKLLTWTRPEEIDRLRAQNPNIFILARLMTKIGAPNQFSDFFVSEVQAQMALFYQRGIRYFEVHNEPNLTIEGWQSSWQNGYDFARFFLEVRDKLKQQFPEALFGYPGLSPNGVPAPGIRYDDLVFLTESDEAACAADWLGVHCYWQSEAEMNAPRGGGNYLEYRRRYPDKLLFITEFSNVAAVDKRTKGRHYARYYQGLRDVPGVGAAFSFIVSATYGFETEVWRDETGTLTDIPAQVGARIDVAAPPPPVPSQ